MVSDDAGPVVEPELAGGRTAPGFTLVLVTHERPHLARRALESALRASRVAGIELEIIVADSSPQPSLRDLPKGALLLQVPDAPRPANNRDAAWRRCRTEWLIFLDDDCELAEDALSGIAAWRRRETRQDIGAAIAVTRFRGPRPFWFRVLEGTNYIADHLWALDREELPWGPTPLAVFSRTALASVDGFDTSIKRPAGGEDVDVGLRLRRHGWRVIGLPEVVVFHTTETWATLRRNCRRAAVYGAGELELQIRWPELVIFDVLSLPLVALVLAAAGTVGLLLGPAPAVAIPAGGALAFLAGQAVEESWRQRKRPDYALGLVLLQLAYRWGHHRGAFQLGRPGAAFFRFDWYRVNGMMDGPSAVVTGAALARWSAIAAAVAASAAFAP